MLTRWAGVGYALFTVLALVGWWVVGDAWWIQPVNLTTFWWTLPAVPLVVVALATGHRRGAALLAIPAVVWLWSYGTAFLPSGGAEAGADAPVLRLASFNTYVGAPDDAHVEALVAAEQPDVLVLQEVFPPREVSLRESLADTFTHVEVVQSEGVGGVAVFSRFPITGVEPVGDPTTRSRNTAVVTLDVEGSLLQVAPVHLLSPCPSCGTSALERLELEGDVRAAEIGAVLDAIAPDVPAIVAGDFNSTERSGPYRTLTGAGFRDPQREVGSGMGFTWPNDADVPAVFRIDWILTRGVEPVAAWVGEGGASDHRPVIVELSVGA